MDLLWPLPEPETIEHEAFAPDPKMLRGWAGGIGDEVTMGTAVLVSMKGGRVVRPSLMTAEGVVVEVVPAGQLPRWAVYGSKWTTDYTRYVVQTRVRKVIRDISQLQVVSL